MAKIKVRGGTADKASLVPLSPVDNHASITLGVAKFSPPLPVGVIRFILVQAITQNIRYTLDGVTDPTATVGFQLVASDPPVLIPMGPGLLPQFIREAAGSILQYQWVE